MSSEESRVNQADLGKPSGTLNGHIYLIDDNEDIRKHLSGVLVRYGLSVESYADAESFLNDSIEVAPAVVLLDMALPGINGVATFKRLIDSGRKTPVIYLSGQSEPQEIIDALKMGAHDFLWKPFSIDKLIEAITKALDADEWRITNQASMHQVGNLWNQLTLREKEVARLMVKGFGNNEISARMGIMPDTIKKHRARVMDKLGVEALADLLVILDGVDLG